MVLAFAPASHAQTNLVSTIAGTGSSGFSGEGGPATSAQISLPISLFVMADGGYLIGDQGNSRVRRVLPDYVCRL
jgi:hypothetical protein